MQIPDDPIIRRMQETGYPPWFDNMEKETGDDGADAAAERRSKWQITENHAGQRRM